MVTACWFGSGLVVWDSNRGVRYTQESQSLSFSGDPFGIQTTQPPNQQALTIRYQVPSFRCLFLVGMFFLKLAQEIPDP